MRDLIGRTLGHCCVVEINDAVGMELEYHAQNDRTLFILRRSWA